MGETISLQQNCCTASTLDVSLLTTNPLESQLMDLQLMEWLVFSVVLFQRSSSKAATHFFSTTKAGRFGISPGATIVRDAIVIADILDQPLIFRSDKKSGEDPEMGKLVSDANVLGNMSQFGNLHMAPIASTILQFIARYKPSVLVDSLREFAALYTLIAVYSPIRLIIVDCVNSYTSDV